MRDERGYRAVDVRDATLTVAQGRNNRGHVVGVVESTVIALGVLLMTAAMTSGRFP